MLRIVVLFGLMVTNDSLPLTSAGIGCTVLLRPTDIAIGRRFAPTTLCQGVTLRIHFTADFSFLSLNPERLFPEGDLRFGSR